MGKIKNSPLVEAIFELRWGEKQQGQFEFKNDETDFFPGIFSQSVKKLGFKFSEQFNSNSIHPDLPYMAKHRFRKAKNKWPCFQIGLGLFTVNQIGNQSSESEDEYDWDEFKPVIESGLKSFDESYPNGIKSLVKPQISLRYQDAFVLADNETLESLVKTKIKADIQISKSFSEHLNIKNNYKDIKLNFAYDISRPKGIISISVLSAMINGEKGFVIDTTVSSPLEDENKSLDFLTNWCEEAHDLQRHSFETLIKTSEL